ncbi:Transcription factor FBD3 [Exophiala dermatitidis]
MNETEREQDPVSNRHPPQGQPVDHSTPPNKRRRIALACSNCRHRKSRCDGGRPVCSQCRELGSECHYEQQGTANSLTVGRSYISQLETRLATIEDNIKRLQNGQSITQPRSPKSPQCRRGGLPGSKDTPTDDGSNGPQIPSHMLYQNNAELGDLDTAEDSIDGMGAIKFTDEEDCGYFGPSSNIAFVRHISLAMARGTAAGQAAPSQPARRSITGTMSVSRPHYVKDQTPQIGVNPSRRGINIYALPSEARTWALIKEYFQKTGQLLPFIHEESFCDTYFQMKRNHFTLARRTWLGLLNIIMAMGTTLSVEGNMSSEERIEESDVYYQRANALCDKESRRNISLELVQYLLIQGQYLQGTQKSVQAWTVHGLAITTAFQLGLHSPRTNSEFPALEAEIRKRVWFGCILLDRTLSMTFGRPSIIPDNYVKLDLPIFNIKIVGQAPTPQNEPAIPQMDAMFYTATIKLYNVMYHIIDTCYGQNMGIEDSLDDSEIFSLVLKGGRLLDEWQFQLLPQLLLRVCDVPLRSPDLDKMEQRNLIVERFNMVLSLRYHNLRILLHRPILEKILDTHGGQHDAAGAGNGMSALIGVENPMLQQIGVTSIETCVDSAMIIISIVHTIVLSAGWRRDLLGAWNYSLFYTFNAGLVLFAALLVAPKDDLRQQRQDPKYFIPSRWDFVDHIPRYLTMAIEALKHLDRGNRVIDRCVVYLAQLSATLTSHSPSTNFDPSYFVVGSNGNNVNTGNGARRSNTNTVPSVNPIDNTTQIDQNLDVGVNQHQQHSSQHYQQQPLATTSRTFQMDVETDLNEFMLDTDLDLFARQFDLFRQY